jgi:branched-chain amino acid transport system substrate-binding protein
LDFFTKLLAVFLIANLVSADKAFAEGVYRIYFDADQTVGANSADAMFLGAQAAFARNDYRLGQRKVEFVRLNHRGNPKRSWLNISKSLADENSLAVFGGVHSPPYITFREQINEAGVVLLLPWSAGAPITRAKGPENSIFRVSVDDAKAGTFLARQVLASADCISVVFMIWDSGWGRSNLPRLEQAFADADREKPKAFMFDTGLGDAGARAIVENVAAEKADCAIIVGNLPEEAKLLNELHSAGTQIRIFSHWGILLGDFVGLVPAQVRNFLDFQFIQTCALQREKEGNEVLKQLMKTPPTKELEGKTSLADIPSAVGFVNAFDMAKILIEAGRSLPAEGDIRHHRRSLITALENLDTPVDGILKRHERPFASYSPEAPDAHEALDQSDLCMARFSNDDHVMIASTSN